MWPLVMKKKQLLFLFLSLRYAFKTLNEIWNNERVHGVGKWNFIFKEKLLT